jgi:hypothetical protein
MMQQQLWMAYLDSSYFSDRKPYEILFNPSYGLGDMIFARTTQFLQKQNRNEWGGTSWAEPALFLGRIWRAWCRIELGRIGR